MQASARWKRGGGGWNLVNLQLSCYRPTEIWRVSTTQTKAEMLPALQGSRTPLKHSPSNQEGLCTTNGQSCTSSGATLSEHMQ